MRGRKEDGDKKLKLGAEEKIHTITLKLVDEGREKQTAEERCQGLLEAELHVDAFLRLMLTSPKDQVYMFPAEGEVEGEQPTPATCPARTSSAGNSWEKCVVLKKL